MFRNTLLFASLALALFALSCSDDDCPTCNEAGPILTLNKHKVDFGATSNSASFVISNDGSGDLAWDLTINYRFAEAKLAGPQHGGWLETSTVSGTGDATITLTANRGELDEIGNSRAVIIINAPDAVNVIRDSIDVHILKGGEWLITDDSTFEDCWEVDPLDWYWVKGFEMPHGQLSVFIDSLAINFCEGDTIIQLLAYDAILNEGLQLYIPNNAVAVSESFFEVESGWNYFPVDWYIAEGPIFYLGYFQLAGARPDLSIDFSSDGDTLCWRARDIEPDPDVTELEWQWSASFETFAIRAFVTPVLEYNPKMAAASQSRDEIEASLRTGYAYKGKYPMSIKPRVNF